MRLIDIIYLYSGTLDIFGDIELTPVLDKEILTDTIIEFCRDFPPQHADGTELKYQTELFFKRKYDDYDKLAKAMLEEYSPLENYDRKEDTNVERKKDVDKTEDTSGSGSTSTQNSVKEGKSAYNASGYQPRSSTDLTAGDTSTSKGSLKGVEGEKESVKTIHRSHGNIGITTSQQMLESEILLRVKYNIYDLIARDYSRNMMIEIF